jgi:hypothetical protein
MLIRSKVVQSTDNRKHVRMSANNKAAVIWAAGGHGPIMCTVADISDGGAGLTVITLEGIPELFHLEIKGETLRRPCKVAWKKEPNSLGVSFI